MRVFGMITTKPSSRYTDYALESFFKNTEIRPSDQFHLIDNDSDYSISSEYGSRINVIKNREPKSFAYNVNQIMPLASAARGDLFFLNNDLIFPAGWLLPLLAPEHAIFSPLSNREVQHYTEAFVWKNSLDLEEYLPRIEAFENISRRHLKNVRGHEQVLSLPFFCVKIPFTVYSEIGIIDERFGMGGGEDYDYCLRAALSNIPVKYIAQSYVLHFNGKSTWSGGEDPEASLTRRNRYSEEFEKKWGHNLRQILIEEDNNLLNKYPEVLDLFKKGDLAEAVTLLMEL